jgi:anti-anti-sigma regulatory factor
MKRIELSQWGTQFMGRSQGAEVRRALTEELGTTDSLVIDCSGVTQMAPSFADECIAKLVKEVAERRPQPKIVFEQLDPAVRSVVRFAIANRRPTEPAAKASS